MSTVSALESHDGSPRSDQGDIDYDQDPATTGPLAIVPLCPRSHTGPASLGGSSASGGTGSGAGAPGSSIAPQAYDKRTHFLCLKCKLPFLFKLMSKSRPNTDEACARAYKSLNERKKKSRSFRIWFDAKSGEDVVVWYREQGSHEQGTKRVYDIVAVSSGTSNYADSFEDEIDTWQTWRWFKRWGLLEQKSLEQLAREWVQTVQAAGAEARFHRGQWHVPEYGGLERRSRRGDRVEALTTRTADVDNVAALRDMHSTAVRCVDEFHKSMTGARTIDEHGPMIDAAASDMPVTVRCEPNSIRPAEREVPPRLDCMRHSMPEAKAKARNHPTPAT